MTLWVCNECEFGSCLYYNKDEKPTYCPAGQDRTSVVLSENDLIKPDWFYFEDCPFLLRK